MNRLAAVLRLPRLVLLLACASAYAAPSDSILKLTPKGDKLRLSWPAQTQNAGGAAVFPEFSVERSTDLQHWQPAGGKLRSQTASSRSDFALEFPREPGPVFYRVIGNLAPSAPHRLGEGGAEVFGYNAELAEELARIGYISVETFSNSFPQPEYLSKIGFDPTTAKYWTNFSQWIDPVEVPLLMTNGFVVSQRRGEQSFADIYYKVFIADLPVFVSTDSILQAWHRSYLGMLEELEEGPLAFYLEQVLTNMSQSLPAAWQAYGWGPLRASLLDADYWLTVARSLWATSQVPCAIPGMGTEALVAESLDKVRVQKTAQVRIFGGYREIDFSQFKVRGHYTASDRLRRYFQTMMWCGRTDLRLASFPPNPIADNRQLGTAIVLDELLTLSGMRTNWDAIERITSLFVGTTDSMTFPQMRALLLDAEIRSPADITSEAVLNELRERLLSGEAGAQMIIGDIFYSPLNPQQLKLPRSFTVCGQKFVLDSWAMSQVSFDRILWPENSWNTVVENKVTRRKPSCLDVAFAVLGNNAPVPEISARILNTNGVPFRDGRPYQHNLAAVRAVIDDQDPAIWTSNIYNGWLAALRALSAPTITPEYPQAIRTRAWAMKNLNTQNASWTQLRHDTVLYAKQSYSPPFLCEYPEGYVEPVPAFYDAMERLARNTAAGLAALNLTGFVMVPPRTPEEPLPTHIDLQMRGATQFLAYFADQMVILRAIAEKELRSEPLNDNENLFLKRVVENPWDYVGSRQYNGWYPGLFYRNAFAGYAFHEEAGCDMWDALVTDVHTDVPDTIVGDPGAVIHEAVGDVNLLMIAVDNGPDRVMYGGPVFSHYEFEKPADTRLTDEDWKATSPPPLPDWTHNYLVP